jgi:hypothetical protein
VDALELLLDADAGDGLQVADLRRLGPRRPFADRVCIPGEKR